MMKSRIMPKEKNGTWSRVDDQMIGGWTLTAGPTAAWQDAFLTAAKDHPGWEGGGGGAGASRPRFSGRIVSWTVPPTAAREAIEEWVWSACNQANRVLDLK